MRARNLPRKTTIGNLGYLQTTLLQHTSTITTTKYYTTSAISQNYVLLYRMHFFLFSSKLKFCFFFLLKLNFWNKFRKISNQSEMFCIHLAPFYFVFVGIPTRQQFGLTIQLHSISVGIFKNMTLKVLAYKELAHQNNILRQLANLKCSVKFETSCSFTQNKIFLSSPVVLQDFRWFNFYT